MLQPLSCLYYSYCLDITANTRREFVYALVLLTRLRRRGVLAGWFCAVVCTVRVEEWDSHAVGMSREPVHRVSCSGWNALPEEPGVLNALERLGLAALKALIRLDVLDDGFQ